MGREIRRVIPTWEHPKDERGHYKPVFDTTYEDAKTEWLRQVHEAESPTDLSECGAPPDFDMYRPAWTPEEATAYQVYETVSEGTPTSPVFETTVELRQWLIGEGHSPKAADEFIKQGWAFSMMMMGGNMYSGIDMFDGLPPSGENES